MTLHEAQQQLLFKLYHLYDNSEAQQIADLVMEHITGWRRIDRVMNKSLKLLPDTVQELDTITQQLLCHKPVQYVLHEAWFADMKLYVDESVLIPRPETEELVDWIVNDVKAAQGPNTSLHILDIGTGSGCIPLALKKFLPKCNLSAIDISESAVEVARRNADQQKLEVDFFVSDIFSSSDNHLLAVFDIIVSNPPYIPESDKAAMQPNVLDFEPWLALFVKNDDPLTYYRQIALVAQTHLAEGGFIYVEIHENLASRLVQLFEQHGFRHIEVRKDLQGKDRMMKMGRG